MESEVNIIEKTCTIAEGIFGLGKNDSETLNFVNEFKSKLDNLQICQEILLHNNQSNHPLVFASDAFKEIITTFISNLTLEVAAPIADWLTQFLISYENAGLEVVIRDLSYSFGTILLHFFDQASEPQEVLSNSLATLHRSLYTDNILQCYHGVLIDNEILDVFIHSTSEYAFSLFSNHFLHGFFDSTKEALFRIAQIEDVDPEVQKLFLKFISQSCSNLAKIIGFARDSPDQTKSPKEKTTIKLENNAFKQELFNIDLINLFFDIYKRFGTYSTLEIIYSYLRIDKSSFSNPKNGPPIVNITFIDFFNFISSNITVLLGEQVHFDVQANIFTLSKIISKLSAFFNERLIAQITKFPELVENVCSFTHFILEQHCDENNIIAELIQFWANIEPLCRVRSQTAEFLKEKAFSIYEGYINFLFAFAITDSRSLDLLRCEIDPFVQHVQRFFNFNFPLISSHLAQQFKSKRQEFNKSLDAYQDNPELAKNVQRQLAISVQLLLLIIIFLSFDRRLQSAQAVCPELFAGIVTLSQQTMELTKQSIVFPELEMSFLIFIKQLKQTLISSPIIKPEVQKALYRLIPPDLGVQNYAATNNYFFIRIMTTIPFFSVCENKRELLPESLLCLKNDISPTFECMAQFLQSPFEGSFSFLANLEDPQNQKYRQQLFTALQAIIDKINDYRLYTLFFQLFEAKFNALPDMGAVCLLGLDINGIFKASLKQSRENFMVCYLKKFNYLFPDHMNAYALALASGTDPNAMVISLRMCKSIVQSSYIKFGSSSADGIILFKFASQIITYSLQMIVSQLESSEINEVAIQLIYFKVIKYIVSIMESLLSNDYVLFDAFMIYGDSVFIDDLIGLAKLFSLIDDIKIQDYHKTFEKVIDFFIALSGNQLKSIYCQQVPDEVRGFVNVMLSYAVNGLSKPFTVKKAIRIIQKTLQFAIDDIGSPQATALLESIVPEIFLKCNCAIWQLLFNSTDKSISANLYLPIQYFMMINQGPYQMVKQKTIEDTPEAKRAEIIRAFAEFEAKFQDALNQDGEKIMKALSVLKCEVNQNIFNPMFV